MSEQNTRQRTGQPAPATAKPVVAEPRGKEIGCFPLKVTPLRSWTTGGRQFGAERPGGRSHAGCDLLVPEGTEIVAVQDGKVRCDAYGFAGVLALEVEHSHVEPSTKEVVVDFIVRYGEIKGVAKGISSGVMVKQGQIIAYVGKLRGSGKSMLHFEMYGPTASKTLTRRDRPPFERDAALIDPTPYLNKWATRR